MESRKEIVFVGIVGAAGLHGKSYLICHHYTMSHDYVKIANLKQIT